MKQYPLPTAFHFSVRFDTDAADAEYAFQEVDGIGSTMETEAYQEGGENRFVHALPKAVKHPKLSLKRGVAAVDSPLVQWCKDVLETGLGVPILPKVVHVSLLNDEGTPLRSWSFDNAYPVGWTVEGFGATKNSLAVEKIELNYDTATRGTDEHNSKAAKEFVDPPKDDAKDKNKVKTP